MSEQCALPDFEQQRRALMLQSGVMSDLSVRTAVGCFSLHRSLVAARCHYMYTRLTSAVGAASSSTSTLPLPDPLLSCDGPWERRDLERLWWHMYATEAQWARDWKAQGSSAHVVGEVELKAWLRLHRLADFVQYEALMHQIEDFILGPLLDHWARQVATNSDDPTSFLPPRVQLLLDACAAAVPTRERIASGLAEWLVTLGASLYARPQSARTEWLTALLDADRKFSAPSSLLSELEQDGAALLSVVCDACVTISRSVNLGVGSWVWLAPTEKQADAILVSMAAHEGDASACSLDYVHYELFDRKRTEARALGADPDLSCRLSTVYCIPSAASSPWRSTRTRACVGRCGRCRSVSDAVHVWLFREDGRRVQKDVCALRRE